MWRKKILLIFPVFIVAVLLLTSGDTRVKLQNVEHMKKGGFGESLKFRVLRIFDGKDETFLVRLALWQGGWKVFKDYPFTGCGFRCMDLIHTQYPDPTGHIKHFRGMHSNFVQLAVDTGILGLMTWLNIWVCFFFSLFKTVTFNEGDLSSQWVVFGSGAAVMAFLAGGVFETNFYDAEVASLLFFIMSLPFAVLNKEHHATKHQP
jgi:O-antigen ligase